LRLEATARTPEVAGLAIMAEDVDVVSHLSPRLFTDILRVQVLILVLAELALSRRCPLAHGSGQT